MTTLNEISENFNTKKLPFVKVPNENLLCTSWFSGEAGKRPLLGGEAGQEVRGFSNSNKNSDVTTLLKAVLAEGPKARHSFSFEMPALQRAGHDSLPAAKSLFLPSLGFGGGHLKAPQAGTLLDLGVSGAKPPVLSNIEQVAGVVRQPRVGSSIKACLNNRKSFAFWKKETPSKVLFTKFRCGSWRCPDCASHVQHRDYARIREALDINPGRWLFLVLTFDPKRYDDKESAYISIKRNTNALLKRLKREYGKILYIQSVEQHQKGWPHVNMLLKFDTEFIKTDEDCEKFRARWFVPNAVDCGFGKMLSCEIAKGDGNAVANYIAKTGLAIIGEVSKVSQVPLNAPIGTRRIRATQKLLKPVKAENTENTGCLIASSVEQIQKTDEKAVLSIMADKYPALKTATSIEFEKISSDTPIVDLAVARKKVEVPEFFRPPTEISAPIHAAFG